MAEAKTKAKTKIKAKTKAKPTRANTTSKSETQMHDWDDIHGFSEREVVRLELEVLDELIEMHLREIRGVAKKTQGEVAAAAKLGQSEISRLENRTDYLLSTLRKYIEALGGRIDIIASVGEQRMRVKLA